MYVTAFIPDTNFKAMLSGPKRNIERMKRLTKRAVLR